MAVSGIRTTHRGGAAWMPIGLALASALLAMASALDPRWPAALDFRREAIASGEIWRLVTAHVVHLSVEHASLNVIALLLVAWIFFAEVDWRLQAAACVVGIAAIDATLWVVQVERYAGLSGVLHAWFATGATGWLLATRQDPLGASKRAWGAALLAGLIVKLVLEQRHHAFWLDGASFEVVTSAHRAGAVAGVVCALVAARVRRCADAAGASRPR